MPPDSVSSAILVTKSVPVQVEFFCESQCSNARQIQVAFNEHVCSLMAFIDLVRVLPPALASLRSV
jgi:hypothetical protein